MWRFFAGLRYNYTVATDTVLPAVPAHGRTRTNRQLIADGALLGITLVWGSSFVLVKDLVAQAAPMLFLSVRFAFGLLPLVLFAALSGKWRGLTWREMRWGTLMGLFLWAGYVLQTVGLQSTTASNGGFITGLYVVMVPLLGLGILGQFPDRWAWTGVGLAAVGLAMLSLRFEGGLRINPGDPLVLACALAFAIQIVLVSRVAQWTDPTRITLIQLGVAGLLNALSAAIIEGPAAGLSAGVWAGAAFLGVVATGLAVLLQMGMQRYTTAVRASIIYSLESVFAAMFGYWLQGDRLGPVAIAGAGLMLAGMFVAELAPLLWRRVGRDAGSAAYHIQEG